MTTYVERVEDWIAQLGRWLNRFSVWQVALVVAIGLLLLPTVPVLFALSACLGLAMFVRGWTREFISLMRLDNEVFPAPYDKIIWVALMLGLPPVGFLLFRAFREAHWPVKKRSSSVNDLF